MQIDVKVVQVAICGGKGGTGRWRIYSGALIESEIIWTETIVEQAFVEEEEEEEEEEDKGKVIFLQMQMKTKENTNSRNKCRFVRMVMEGEEQGVQEEEEEEKDSIRIKGVELFGDLFRA